jgi:type II secretion system protein G
MTHPKMFQYVGLTPSTQHPVAAVYDRRPVSAFSPREGEATSPGSAIDRNAAKPSTLASRPSNGFTLIELLVVVTIIGILAGLVIAAIGGVQKTTARARAETEVAALSRAIMDYHRDFAEYPKADPAFLYAELTTDDSDQPNSINKTKIYFEPTPGIVGTNNEKKCFVDPWGMPYIYETNQDNIQNRGFFDLYTKAGPTTNTKAWIRN